MTDAEKDLAIEGVNKTLRHLGLEPWKDGRSVTDGKRPWEQHIGMILGALKAEIDATKDLESQIRSLKGQCLSESDHASFCENELKNKGDWCPMCRALDSIGISQVREVTEKRVCDECKGSGEIGLSDGDVACPKCGGSGDPDKPGIFEKKA